jgi:DNA-binding NtrC family response regulator
VARLVHARSARAAGPLVERSAGSRPDVEDAEALAPGGAPLQQAEGGTLVIHEVACLGPLAQQALHRVLDERGGEEGSPDVRLVATTHVDLQEEVRSGRFREELLYRLNVLSLPVPALSERLDDLAELGRACLEQLAGPQGQVPRLGADALEVLRSRAWPGGLAELRRALEAALSVGRAPSVLGPEHLDPVGRGPSEEPGAGTLEGPGLHLHLSERTLRAAEEALIRRVLAETEGNKLRSAEILGIHRTTLYHKLRDYGIAP